LDVDQLDFRLVALWPAAEKDRVKRRPGCHRAPEHEADHFALLRRGIEHGHEPRHVVIANANSASNSSNLLRNASASTSVVLPPLPHAGWERRGDQFNPGNFLLDRLAITADVLLRDLVAILPRRHPSCKPLPGVDPKPGALRIPHPSGHRRFGIRHRVTAAIVRNLNDFFR
jgi:hypothetical protein